MCHEFFDELRNPETKLSNGNNLPTLFDFTTMELSIKPHLIHKLVPPHAVAELKSRGIDINNFTPITIEQKTNLG